MPSVNAMRQVLRSAEYPGPLNTDTEVSEAYSHFVSDCNEAARRNRDAILAEPPHREEQPIIDAAEDRELYEPPEYDQYEQMCVDSDREGVDW